jgi:UDP-glucuronate 4-epimerase
MTVPIEKIAIVTGAAGFIGYHLSRRLLNEGYRVRGIDNLDPYYDVSLKEARLERLSGDERFSLLRADLSDLKAIEPAFVQGDVEVVVNLAAQAGVRYSIDNPLAYVDTNLVGFAHILEGCRHNGVEHLAYASSSSVYGANTSMPFSVHDNVDHPLSLYAASKKANELMAHTYSHLYRLPTTGCASSPSTAPGAGRTWRCSCSPAPSSRRAHRGVQLRQSTGAISPTSTTSSRA